MAAEVRLWIMQGWRKILRKGQYIVPNQHTIAMGLGIHKNSDLPENLLNMTRSVGCGSLHFDPSTLWSLKQQGQKQPWKQVAPATAAFCRVDHWAKTQMSRAGKLDYQPSLLGCTLLCNLHNCKLSQSIFATFFSPHSFMKFSCLWKALPGVENCDRQLSNNYFPLGIDS